MEKFSDIDSFPDRLRGSVIAIGNFDGVHKGHHYLLAKARKIAEKEGKSFGVLTFEPHPRHVFRPDDPPFRITPEPIKLRRLEEVGADFVFAVRFDWNFASTSAENFIEEMLRGGLEASQVVVGNNFHFGQLRKGDAKLLKEMMPGVTIVKPKDGGGEVISSSRIRTLLRHGWVGEANELLGWEWEIQGEIMRGDRRGHELGFPTANVPLGDTLHPGYGVYASLVKIVEDGDDSRWLPAATNIGIRPMFKLEEGQAEAHILNFDQDIYEKTLRIRPVRQIRGEAKFASVDELISQMKRDCEQVRDILGV
jgi:riboflavin kinase/FMN adenylyltransferase